MKASYVIKLLGIWVWVVLSFLAPAYFMLYRTSSNLNARIWAEYAGGLQARLWFNEGKYRLLELSPDEKTRFTGRKDGEFEIWNWTHYANVPWWAKQPGDAEFVETFNLRMRELWERRQKRSNASD